MLQIANISCVLMRYLYVVDVGEKVLCEVPSLVVELGMEADRGIGNGGFHKIM